jgi:hypothetical protein
MKYQPLKDTKARNDWAKELRHLRSLGPVGKLLARRFRDKMKELIEEVNKKFPIIDGF